ncbi:hypothetical protein [Shewanella holmiensis]|uniref:Uncharacterized protein n=1 Tax=Shewanella holmiensis TaxID=2952222 RepID=A0A9X2WMB0_9GAMM|nr:hypothetical protein [Shewanella holmiensis]MCT7942054.1 hypothetical protein [Shewanella holmiensis]
MLFIFIVSVWHLLTDTQQVRPCSSADPSMGRMVGSQITIMNLSIIYLIGKF